LKKVDDLGLFGSFTIVYKNYIKSLQIRYITDREDELVSQKDPSGVYTPKIGLYFTFSGSISTTTILVVERTMEVKVPTKRKTLSLGNTKLKNTYMGYTTKMKDQRAWEMSTLPFGK